MNTIRVRSAEIVHSFPAAPYFFAEFDEPVHIEEFGHHLVDWLKSRGETVVDQPGPETIYTGFTRLAQTGKTTYHIHSTLNPNRSVIVEWETASTDPTSVVRLMKDYAKDLKRNSLPTAAVR